MQSLIRSSTGGRAALDQPIAPSAVARVFDEPQPLGISDLLGGNTVGEASYPRILATTRRVILVAGRKLNSQFVHVAGHHVAP